jgi:hypothetical protein
MTERVPRVHTHEARSSTAPITRVDHLPLRLPRIWGTFEPREPKAGHLRWLAEWHSRRCCPASDSYLGSDGRADGLLDALAELLVDVLPVFERPGENLLRDAVRKMARDV